jgi:hypothetical protein
MHRSNIMLSMEDLPVWRWSALVTEDSFVKIPPNFTWPDEEDEPDEEIKAAIVASGGGVWPGIDYGSEYKRIKSLGVIAAIGEFS